MALDDQRKSDFKFVGTRPNRPDGMDKVTGRAKFGADMYAPGMLHGAILRSPHAHARITKLDVSRAEKLKGVKSFKIKFKGDGNTYKLRLRQGNRRASYSSDFISVKNKWLEVDIPVENFKPTWRGYTYSDYPAVEIEKINSLGLHISDKQEGEFTLEIEYIKATY